MTSATLTRGPDTAPAGTPALRRTARPRTSGRRFPVAATVLGISLALTLIPLLYLFSLSFMGRADVAAGHLLPSAPAWGNWEAALTTSGLPRAILNSVIAAGFGALITLAFALPAAWAMVRHQTGGKTLTASILAPWLLPPIVAVIPLFTLLRILGLNNTLVGLAVVYALANTGLAVFLLQGFVKKVPLEIEEAAALDGAGTLRILFRVVLPLLTPALIAVGVVVAVLNYNEFLLALFLTQGPDSQTVPVILSLLLGDKVQDFGQLAAASLVGVAPVFAAAVFLQRGLVAGLTSGAVK
ncbi:carbohydrate ABC transporter permease [Mycetocola sp. JXN-3]|uniref:carbohydrate ABC transporter permease n=1 Tax=Mycetocola sp. JXN-3 TaxID=2116510 RepID=UPI00165D06EF|nr:carbohydrate ABC transporter permease [Mycetocola sp. JXN-3]